MGNFLAHAKRMDVIQPFRVMALLAEARQLEATGRSIVHMEVGEPDFDTAEPIVQAGITALEQGFTHYTPATGDPQLRQAIADYYRQRFDVDIDPQRVIVTPGASGALQLVLAMMLDPGQQVLMADPGYPCNRNFVHLLGGVPCAIPVNADSAFQLTRTHLQQHWQDNSRCALLATPSNPTGTMIPREDMQAMHDFVQQQGGHLIVDEIYQGLSYEGEAYTALSVSDDIFVINSFSKYFGMTGWRVGWVVAPAEAVDDLDKLAQNLFLAAPTPSQRAAIAAFQPDTLQILEQRRELFRQRRDYLVPALEALGFAIPQPPQGAFYVYADCSRLTDDSMQFCHDLLHQAGVAITPGIDFGDHQQQQHVRLAYTTSLDQLQEGIQRLQQFLKT